MRPLITCTTFLHLQSLVTVAMTLAAHGASEPPEPISEGGRFGTLLGAVGSDVDNAVQTSCSTTSVKGLSVQIVAMMNCLNPSSMAEVPEVSGLDFGAAVFPYLQSPAKDALLKAVAAKPASVLGINSMFRTVAQQYLLYRWYQAGTCGIGLAAKPGNSNHESGLAFDTSDTDVWKTTLQANGFKWLGTSDPVHFDYVGAGIVDLYGQGVLAFQTLWNQKNPNDLIDEDGLYGSQTGSRIAVSPAAGFTGAVVCPGSEPVPDVVTVPDVAVEPDVPVVPVVPDVAVTPDTSVKPDTAALDTSTPGLPDATGPDATGADASGFALDATEPDLDLDTTDWPTDEGTSDDAWTGDVAGPVADAVAPEPTSDVEESADAWSLPAPDSTGGQTTYRIATTGRDAGCVAGQGGASGGVASILLLALICLTRRRRVHGRPPRSIPDGPGSPPNASTPRRREVGSAERAATAPTLA